tara:strand:+ start:11 stop:1003 length:993 start_codon:yes stop_codon:yes gene_type:complete
MAFLDNSGDIILDAILTETGRRQMAGGTFKITKFAVGDDEIDYALYDKTNSGGPAYYDLEILQTPIAEAGLQLNYGLISSLAQDILYMPTTRINELSMELNNVTSTSGMFYVTDTSGDIDGSTISSALTTAGVSHMKGAAIANANYVLLESGLDVAFGQVPLGSSANRQSYLIANGLMNSSFYCFNDSRFFSGVQGPTSTSKFANDGTNHELNASISLIAGASTTIGVGLDNYQGARLRGVANEIYYYGDGVNTEANYSVLGGPRSTVLAVSPVVKSGLGPEYTLYGFTNQASVAGLSINVDYIDTTFYIVGATTGTTAQIPVRVIRRTV